MMEIKRLTLFLAILGVASALECTQIPDSSIIPGHLVSIPENSTEPVVIQPNYSCVYNVKTPPMVYAHVTLENQLKGTNDMITVRDAQLMRTIVSSRAAPRLSFYIFPNTTSTFQVVTKSVDMQSKFRMSIRYVPVPTPVVSQLQNDKLDYFLLNDLQANSLKAPQTLVSSDNVSLTVAQSGWSADSFVNYFVIDGDFSNPKTVKHLSDVVNTQYESTGGKLTIVGFDNLVSQSSVIFSPVAQLTQFDQFSGVTTFYDNQTVTVAAENSKKVLSVISKNTDSVVFRSVDILNKSSSCSVKAVTSPATSSSTNIADLTMITQFPYTITQKYFSIIVENCSATFTLNSPLY